MTSSRESMYFPLGIPKPRQAHKPFLKKNKGFTTWSFWIRFNMVGHLYNCSMPSVLLVNKVLPPTPWFRESKTARSPSLLCASHCKRHWNENHMRFTQRRWIFYKSSQGGVSPASFQVPCTPPLEWTQPKFQFSNDTQTSQCAGEHLSTRSLLFPRRGCAFQMPEIDCKWFWLRDIKMKIKRRIMKHKLTFNGQKMRLFTTAHKYI